MEPLGSEDMRTNACVRELAELYMLWNRAEPGAGHDENEAHWRSRRR